MRVVFRFVIAVGLCLGSAGVSPVHGQDQATSPTLAVARDGAVKSALDFLARVEERNAVTKTLAVEFDQIRVDTMFDEEVKSSGRFWYKSPSNYYAEYESEHSSKVWSDERRLVEYIPTLNQVDVVPVQQGEEAPVTQVLLGFGVKVEKILDLFTVRDLMESEKGLVAIEFMSRDLDRTLGFSRIVVRFDEKLLEPRRIEMEDSTGTRTIILNKVRFNPEVKDSIFKLPKFDPSKVDINGAEYL